MRLDADGLKTAPAGQARRWAEKRESSGARSAAIGRRHTL